MSQFVRSDILAVLDAERRAMGTPSPSGDVVVERTEEGSECRIVFASCPAEEIDELIRRERDAAVAGGYSLEWKYYGHDTPIDLIYGWRLNQLTYPAWALSEAEPIRQLTIENDRSRYTFYEVSTPEGPGAEASDATLGHLSVNRGTLLPEFDPTLLEGIKFLSFMWG